MNATLLTRLGRDTRYVFLGFPLAVISFVLVLTGLAVGIGTAAIFVGLVLISVVLVMARGLAHVDRIRLSDLYGRPVMRLPYRTPPKGAGPLRRLLNPIVCSRSWLDALHALLRFPVATVAFIICVLWWTLSLGGVLYPLWGWSLYFIPGYTDVGTFVLPEYPALATLVIYMVGGVLFALTLPLVMRFLARTESTLARALLLAPEDTSVQVLTAKTPEAERQDDHSGSAQRPAERRFVSAR
ncbi:sensor domain-containing protein [Nocardiopsis exhalans]|uniref:Sensor domain-containing protein n=1 Tax=Nocardiopsis exhalans TaxID=163604 RepID=A0ABY5D2C8_9ACTN|nr:sensor domain-containing protein [Nocardiopsis exhalans]USY17015.1 sensor domain-containing protein [Nocardiopsis exhalans]